jgi:hypothetical protein
MMTISSKPIGRNGVYLGYREVEPWLRCLNKATDLAQNLTDPIQTNADNWRSKPRPLIGVAIDDPIRRYVLGRNVSLQVVLKLWGFFNDVAAFGVSIKIVEASDRAVKLLAQARGYYEAVNMI